VPARFAGAAEARSPTINQANDATVAERNARREEFLSIINRILYLFGFGSESEPSFFGTIHFGLGLC
jgi:hypothetical protein